MRALGYGTALVLGLCAACGSAKQAGVTDQSTNATLKNWAISRCLAHAFAGTPAGADAAVSAAAYLEQGDSPSEAYEQLDALAKTFVAKSYSGSVPGQYNTMKCVDLYSSPDLAKAIERAGAKRR